MATKKVVSKKIITKGVEKEGKEEEFEAFFKQYRGLNTLEPINTGSYILNALFGGGLPRASAIELFSESGVGKTTIALSICYNLCKQGHKVLYIDSEASVSVDLLTKLNMMEMLADQNHTDRPFILVQCSSFNEAASIIDFWVTKNAIKGSFESDIKLVVIDSITGLTSESLLKVGDDTDIETQKIASQATLTGYFMKRYKSYKIKYSTTFMYINQLRTDPNLGSFVGKLRKSTGGSAMEYFTDIRIEIRPTGYRYRKATEEDYLYGEPKKDKVICGRDVTLTAIKSKMSNGMIPYPLTVLFGDIIRNVFSFPYVMRKKYVVNSSGDTVPMLYTQGSWNVLTLGSEEDDSYKIQGEDNIIEFFKNPEILQKIYDRKLVCQEDFNVFIKGDFNGK